MVLLDNTGHEFLKALGIIVRIHGRYIVSLGPISEDLVAVLHSLSQRIQHKDINYANKVVFILAYRSHSTIVSVED